MSKAFKILIVNSNEKVLADLALELTRAGNEAVMTSSGESALVRIKEESFDLVYCDLNMPGLNGLEVAKQVQVACPGLKVILYACQEGEIESEIVFWSADKVKLVDEPCALSEISEFTDHLLNPDMTRDRPSGE